MFSNSLSQELLLIEVLRNGARALLAQALEAEVSSLLSCHADKLTDDGRRRLARHGHLPEREIMTGIGPVKHNDERAVQRARYIVWKPSLG